MATPPTTVANMSGVFESVVKLANSRGYYILYALKGNIECETHSYTHTMTLTLTWSHHHHHQCFHHHRHHRCLSVCWAYTTYEQSSAQWRGINIKLMDTSLIYVHIYVSQIDKYCVGRRQREGEGEGWKPSQIDVMNNLFYLLIYMQAQTASPPRSLCLLSIQFTITIFCLYFNGQLIKLRAICRELCALRTLIKWIQRKLEIKVQWRAGERGRRGVLCITFR